jgi:hypothetical protein
MTEKHKYVVVDGKHDLGVVDGERKYARKGDIVDLTAEEAARYKGKFTPATPPPPQPSQSVAEETKGKEGEEKEEE